MEPGVEPRRARLPGGGGSPDADERVLGDVFRRRAVVQHPRRKAEDAGQFRGDQQPHCRCIAATDPCEQGGIRIVIEQAWSFAPP